MFWFSVNLFVPVLPIYYHGLGMDDTEIGFAMGAFSIGSVLFRMVAGKAVDRYGSLPVMTVGVSLSVLAIVSYYFDSSIGWSLLSRFAHGAGISGYAAAGLTMATMLNEPGLTTESLAAYTLFTMIGMSAATSSANWLFDQGGLLVVVMLGALATVITLLLFPRNPAVKIPVSAGDALPMLQVIVNPGVYIPTLNLLAVNTGFGSVMTFFPLLMLSRGWDDFFVFYLSYGVSVLLSRFWVGRLCRIIGAEKMAFHILVFMSAALCIVGWGNGNWVAPAAGVGIGIGFGLAFPAMATTVNASVRSANKGVAFSFYATAVDVGFAVGSIAMGFIASQWGYSAIFQVAAIYIAVYALLYQFHLLKKLTVRA